MGIESKMKRSVSSVSGEESLRDDKEKILVAGG